MKWEAGYLLGLALQSVPEPRKVARDLFAEGFSRQALWHMLALLLVLLTMVSILMIGMTPPAEGTDPVRQAWHDLWRDQRGGLRAFGVSDPQGRACLRRERPF